ncbi:MAG: hypothetical protein GY830_09720, partial [Bacteroidetes bacterium]|nr:hypothetical protein [Bacteroidota bacterium]
MQFAVLHICKYKNLGGIGAHIDRKYISQNVDISKTHFNEKIENDETLGNILGNIESKMPLNERIEEEFVSAKNDLENEVFKKINQKYSIQRKIRSDAVKALGIIMTGSHSRMKEIEQDSKLFNEWKKANYEFACDEFGKDNIIRMTLHLDEKTPHFHCVFVPITSDGGLSAKHYVNGKKSLRDLQDKYA